MAADLEGRKAAERAAAAEQDQALKAQIAKSEAAVAWFKCAIVPAIEEAVAHANEALAIELVADDSAGESVHYSNGTIVRTASCKVFLQSSAKSLRDTAYSPALTLKTDSEGRVDAGYRGLNLPGVLRSSEEFLPQHAEEMLECFIEALLKGH
jgi:hypothetical protein